MTPTLHPALLAQEKAEGFGDDSLIPEFEEDPSGERQIKLAETAETAQLEPIEFEPLTFEPMPEEPPEWWHSDGLTDASSWRWRLFPMGGCVYHDVAARMQRQDQGQDFEVPWGRHVIAAGWGKCVHHLSDGPFPNGFGSPYAVIYFPPQKSCRFAGLPWYLGHDNAEAIPVGRWFHTRDVLARPNHSLNSGWGWTEFGHAPGGYPGPMGEGARQHWRFSPKWEWSN